MSSTFDIMQTSLIWLKAKLEDDAQVQDVIGFLSEIVDDLHDYCHHTAPGLNRTAGNKPNLLTTALQYTDDEERQKWLKWKSTSRVAGKDPSEPP